MRSEGKSVRRKKKYRSVGGQRSVLGVVNNLGKVCFLRRIKLIGEKSVKKR